MNTLIKIKNLLDSIESSDEDEARLKRIKKYWQAVK